MSGFLSYWELANLAKFNVCFEKVKAQVPFKRKPASSSSTEGRYENEPLFRQVQAQVWNPIFDTILRHQPEVQPLIEQYIDKSITDYHLWSSFAHLFANKIKFTSVENLFFNYTYPSHGPTGNEKVAFFISLIDSHDGAPGCLTETLYHQLVEKPGSTLPAHHLQDLGLAYLHHLAKYGSEKEQHSKHLEILPHLKPEKEIYQKKKLKCYLQMLPKDEESYQRLMAEFFDHIAGHHELRVNLERALKKFPAGMQEDYDRRKSGNDWEVTGFNIFFNVKNQPLFDRLNAYKLPAGECYTLIRTLTEKVVRYIMAQENVEVTICNPTAVNCTGILNFKNADDFSSIHQKLNDCLPMVATFLDKCLDSQVDLSNMNQFSATLCSVIEHHRFNDLLPVQEKTTVRKKI